MIGAEGTGLKVRKALGFGVELSFPQNYMVYVTKLAPNKALA